MPRNNPTDKPVNVWLPFEDNLKLKDLQNRIEGKTGVRPTREELVLEAALIGLAELEKIQ